MRDRAQIINGVLIGVFGSFLWGQISSTQSPSPESTYIEWHIFYMLYSSVAAFINALFKVQSPWKWSMSLMLANYVSGYFFVRFWGQLGPFDLIFMFVYTIPCIVISHMSSSSRTIFLSKGPTEKKS